MRRGYLGCVNYVDRELGRLLDALVASGRAKETIVAYTADHGEMLGENNRYCHWSRESNKILVEVPWLIIDKGIKAVKPAEKTTDEEKDKAQPSASIDKEVSEETKRKIQEKLRALGYQD